MRERYTRRSFFIGTWSLLCWLLSAGAAPAQDVSFSRDVLPVLSDRCFHCHGPDEANRQANLRLDVEADAKADLGGYAAIVEGDLAASELWQRVSTDDTDLIMPPADSHRKPLTTVEKQHIQDWIQSGATWGKHWAFEKPQQRTPPLSNRHPIDAFIDARLADSGLKKNPPASTATQLRRLSLDLTGLVPTADELDAFISGKEDWQAAIDRLLVSPRHAERMAMWWLDAARYSDSDGFQLDETRQNWPWRDWVIHQFQQNRSFRDFTIEQFAGDLLPNATDDQILATCFHRNHMTNGEGGRDPEESRIDYVIDRVNTTGTVWLGLTLGCVQCHAHKFDPISQENYYSLSAFFNNIDEDGRAGLAAKPYLKYQSSAVSDQVARMTGFVEQCQVEEQEARQQARERFEQWLVDLSARPSTIGPTWWTPEPTVTSVEGTEFSILSDGVVQATGPIPFQDDYRIVLPLPRTLTQVSGFRIQVLPHPNHVNHRFTRDGNGEFALTSVLVAVRREGSPTLIPLNIRAAIANFEADKKRETNWDVRYARISETLNDDARDGWTTEGAAEIAAHNGVFELQKAWPVQPGDSLVVVLRHRSTHGHANIGRFRLSVTPEFGESVRRADGGSPLQELKAHFTQPASLDQPLPKELKSRLLDQYLLGDDRYQRIAERLNQAKIQLAEYREQANPRKVMVLAERQEARKTHVLVRGVWDSKGPEVGTGVIPAVLPWPPEKASSRLDLARWIMDPENPLTARVIVNHLWQMFFEKGLVRTPEDFGLQGQFPTHPDLLDWLAIELIESDWNLQHVIRLIVTSDTYRQSSVNSESLQLVDPKNRLLARAPRYRMPAWMIRDNALHVSGLLNPAIGGPPVKPYQPSGVWSEITMGRFTYQPSLGPAQYRRTVYAFWRRSSAPTFLFDSAQRRVCEVGIRRTNTPLQALTLLNDETMLEASRALADQVLKLPSQHSRPINQTGLQFLARRILCRDLAPAELRSMQETASSVRDDFLLTPDAARDFATVGQQAPPEKGLEADTAAWMVMASLLLNLDEAITRE